MKLFMAVALLCFQAKGIVGDEGRLKNLLFYQYMKFKSLLEEHLSIIKYIFELECFKVFANDYSGKVATTDSGRTCVNWEDVPDNILLQLDLEQWIKDKNFPEKSVKDAKNYCRSPDSRADYFDQLSRPWCFITDNYESTNINRNEVLEECNVHRCKGKCLIFSYFFKYQMRKDMSLDVFYV